MIQNALAYVIIPFYTIIFVRNTNLFTTNFSVISSLNGRQTGFLLWGTMVGVYFYRELHGILPMVPNSRKEKLLTTASCVLLFLAIFTPYLPEKLPFQAFFHILCAFSASVLLLLCLSLLIFKLYRKEPSVYHSYLVGITVTALVSVLLLFVAGIVSSALEIFFTVSCTILIRRLHRRLLSRRLKDFSF